MQITLWAGIFPVVITQKFALALTIYTVATQSLLYYVKELQHIEALWFANIANQLLWWTYVKAAWRTFSSKLTCTTITFKVLLYHALVLYAHLYMTMYSQHQN